MYISAFKSTGMMLFVFTSFKSPVLPPCNNQNILITNLDIKTRCDGVEDCGVEDSSDELNCKTLYWGDEKGAYAKEKPPKPTDIGEGSKVKG